MELIWFIVLGLASGFLAGLLGLGGGIVTVPVLALIVFPYLGSHVWFFLLALLVRSCIPCTPCARCR